MKKTDKIDKYIVSKDLLVFLYWIMLNIKKAIDVIKKYIGSITYESIISSLASIVAIQESGGVIILEMMKKEYSMSEIAQIVESNGARILSAYITDVDDRDIIKLTLKLNIIDIAPIIQTFERYKYTVAASYNQSENKDNLIDRYDLLMRYLNQ